MVYHEAISLARRSFVSPIFYYIYSGLLLELRHSGLGAHIEPVYCEVVLQADDIDCLL